jgi:hypothetical protein
MCVTFTANYFFSQRRHSISSDVFLMTDFMNIEIKLIQSFKYAHKYKLCVYICS